MRGALHDEAVGTLHIDLFHGGNLDLVAGRMDFRCADGLEVIREYKSDPNVIFFIDPCTITNCTMFFN